jgi:ABC-type antimicrobial peptide transport system permease subunit
MAYYPWQQVMPARMGTIIVRTQGDARAAAASLSKMVATVNPDLLLDVRTLSSQIDDSIGTERMLARISGFFGVLALALTCIGLYGIMAHGVTRRTREIGIRIALGAVRSDVVWMMLRETLIVAAAGLIAGLPLAAGLTRLTGSFLFGVTPNDPMVLGAAVLALLGVSLVAGYLPARRASKVDAVVALRYE